MIHVKGPLAGWRPPGHSSLGLGFRVWGSGGLSKEGNNGDKWGYSMGYRGSEPTY